MFAVFFVIAFYSKVFFSTVPRKNWKKCASASRIDIRRGKHDDDDDDGMKSSLSQAI